MPTLNKCARYSTIETQNAYINLSQSYVSGLLSTNSALGGTNKLLMCMSQDTDTYLLYTASQEGLVATKPDIWSDDKDYRYCYRIAPTSTIVSLTSQQIQNILNKAEFSGHIFNHWNDKTVILDRQKIIEYIEMNYPA